MGHASHTEECGLHTEETCRERMQSALSISKDKLVEVGVDG